MAGLQVNTDEMKRAAAEAALQLVNEGMVVGLGSGSTALEFIRLLGDRVAAGLDITAVATSRRTASLAESLGIPLVKMNGRVDLAVDGADAIDRFTLGAVKGLGGALTRERIVAEYADTFALIVDERKVVSRLVDSLTRLPIPVAVVPFGWEVTAARLATHGNPRLRLDNEGAPFPTDDGNYILDILDIETEDIHQIGCQIKSLAGVVDHGLFLNLATIAFVGGPEGVVELRPGARQPAT